MKFLYRLVEHCEYGELREQLLRDRIVVGVSDDALSDRLQAQADLTLDQSVQISRQSEARKQQRGVVRDGRDVNTTIEFVKRDQRPSTKPNTARRSGTCKWCGSQQEHDRNSCPARQAVCHLCSKLGHFRSVCRGASEPEIKPLRSKHHSHSVGGPAQTRGSDLTGGLTMLWAKDVALVCSVTSGSISPH